MPQLATLALPALCTCLATAGALAQSFDLGLTDGSGLAGALDVEAQTSGSLIGDWDATANPTGTRTKPGLFGGFGPTENLPVPASVGLGLGGDLDSASSGGLTLMLDANAGEFVISGAAFDLLDGGGLPIPASVTLRFDSFRTRAPDSTFFGGIPITLPLGEATLTALSFAQTEQARGLLTPAGPDAWTFAIALPGTLAGSVDALGMPLELPPAPAVLPLVGTLALVEGVLTLTADASLDQRVAEEPMAPLPPLPLPLPTILPAGSTANLVANLTLDTLSMDFAADIMLQARGIEGCPADCNGDGTLDIFDFLCFQGVFASGSLEADCDKDGELTVFDFFCFLNEFDAGCR